MIAAMKQPENLSARTRKLRDYYFEGLNRNWNNEYLSFTTGSDYDTQYDEITYYIVPETYAFQQIFRSSHNQNAQTVALDSDFFKMSLPERKAFFLREVMVNHCPQEIIKDDLLAGARFNVMTSKCWTRAQTKQRDKRIYGKTGARAMMKWLHDHGYGNSGATSGHLIPDYEKILKYGFKEVYEDLDRKYSQLSIKDKKGKKGSQLKAMMIAASMPRQLAEKYRLLCEKMAAEEKDEKRKSELHQMAANLAVVPWNGATSFYEAIQSLWLTHMLIMADENYPGPGVSFGRLDQYLYPYYEQSVKDGMTREFMKDILGCFWFHCNTVYDAQIGIGGNQGITAGFGQLFNLSGLGKDNKDMTNDLTYLLLEMIDDMSPILEPKPNVRLHRNSPEKLLDKVVEMVLKSQGAPFLLNFDERSMAGMLREAKEAGIEHLINVNNVFDYASVGCLENTMVGNDRSGTVDNNLNLLKAVELVLNNGKDLLPYTNEMTGKTIQPKQDGPVTGSLEQLDTFDKFFEAYTIQTSYIIRKMVEVYEQSESLRADFAPTPYVSLLVNGCAVKGMDVTEGGAEISFTTIEGVTYATTVDSLLAIKYLVYDKKECTLMQLVQALKDNWEGHEILQAKAKNRAPKYGRDDDAADDMAKKVMGFWTSETWKHTTLSTNRRFRPGMLSWNYWVGDGYIMAASADGRKKGQFLSNAICPSNGADLNGPTSNANSVGKALGGKSDEGDFEGYLNSLPNGASHTITFSISLLKTPGHKEKFKAFLRGYIENGGTALQINILDAEMLKDAQKHPGEYKHLLVRVTGYNAYFASIGKELQDEIIARENHQQF
ncbi:MAG: hypothetical protein JXQ23_08600 [Clostridia bacterium]|nr:hypothetical protein [Clostridia bacterium]